MRLLFVVQRYGHDVPGGAEQYCREFATRLLHRRHDVEVLTTCARSYVDWANSFAAGTEEVDGVRVHRLQVRQPRDNRLFSALNGRVRGSHIVPLYLQEEWMRQQGPLVDGLREWLSEHAAAYDAVAFFTYLYYTTWAGLPVAAGLRPTVLHPTAHDEPPLYLPIYDVMFRQPSAFAFATAEEADLVRRRFRVRRASTVVGIGVDLQVQGDQEQFRRAYGLEDRPYLVCVGRVDPHKGSDEIFDFFVAYKERNPGPLALVVVGDTVKALPPRQDVVVTGFLDDHGKQSAVHGALALVQPSYFESFSLVLMEAWVQHKPALVQQRCDVLAGHARRSGGALPYSGFAEFEAAVDMLVHDAAMREELGRRGRVYVEEHYRWDAVLDRYEGLIRRATVERHR